MSRSHKKNPIVKGTAKGWKQQGHSTERAMARERIQQADPDELVLPTKYEASDFWNGPDYTSRFDPKSQSHLLRK